MILKMLVVGPIQSNCYILGCERTKQAAVIDPGEARGHAPLEHDDVAAALSTFRMGMP